MTLAEFLLARLDDDERNCFTAGDPESWCDRAEGDHYDSKRIFADIASKRQLIDQVFRYEATIDGEWGCCCRADEIAAGGCELTAVDEIAALRILAQPYDQHPDYDQAWKAAS